MLKYISFKFLDFEKIDIIIPYFIENLRRKNILNKITTIEYLFDILYSINYKELILPILSYNYFDKYIFNAFLKRYESKNNLLIVSFINSLYIIIKIFLISSLISLNKLIRVNLLII